MDSGARVGKQYRHGWRETKPFSYFSKGRFQSSPLPPDDISSQPVRITKTSYCSAAFARMYHAVFGANLTDGFHFPLFTDKDHVTRLMLSVASRLKLWKLVSAGRGIDRIGGWANTGYPVAFSVSRNLFARWVLSVLRLTRRTAWTESAATQHTLPMPSASVLQNRIRELCMRTLAPDSDWQEVLQELRTVLHEHSENLRKLVAEKLAGPE